MLRVTRRTGAALVLIAGGLIVTGATYGLPSMAGKKRCHYVVKVVHGHKKRIRVCHTVKPDPLKGSTAVKFTARDGLSLEGRLWGQGTTGVVLVHGNSPTVGQGEWFPFAPLLAAKGVRVLTFDLGGFCPRRGYGCSDSGRNTVDTWLDVAGAVDYLHVQGVENVFLVGGSLGGHTVLWAASRPGVDVAGVIALSAPQNALGGPDLHYDLTPGVLAQIQVPKLYIAGRQDVEEGYSPAADAQSMYDASLPPKQLLLLGSTLHASALLTVASADRARARQAVYDFVATSRMWAARR